MSDRMKFLEALVVNLQVGDNCKPSIILKYALNKYLKCKIIIAVWRFGVMDSAIHQTTTTWGSNYMPQDSVLLICSSCDYCLIIWSLKSLAKSYHMTFLVSSLQDSISATLDCWWGYFWRCSKSIHIVKASLNTYPTCFESTGIFCWFTWWDSVGAMVVGTNRPMMCTGHYLCHQY